MRLPLITLAVLATVAMAASRAQAWHDYGSRPGSCYRGPGYSAGGYFGLSHADAAARIMAKYSRYNHSVHPRSYYNRPYYYGPNYYTRRPSGYYGHRYEYYGRGFEFRYGY